MGGGSGGTQNVGPPKWQQPYIKGGLADAQSLYNQQRGNPNSTVAPISANTQQAWDLGAQRATNGSPTVTAAQNLATTTLNGGFLGKNPYLDDTFNRAALQTQNQLASQFAGAGRNVDASEGLRAQQLNDLATGIYGGAYDAERNRQQDALGAAIPLANQDYVDLGQLGQIGAAQEGYNQELLNQPGNTLDQYLGRVGGNVGSSTSGTSAYNRGAGAIGGGLLGYQAGSMLGNYMGGNPNVYGGWGSLIGGLGGYLGG